MSITFKLDQYFNFNYYLIIKTVSITNCSSNITKENLNENVNTYWKKLIIGIYIITCMIHSEVLFINIIIIK